MLFVFLSLSVCLQEAEASQPWTAVYAEAVVLSGAGTRVTAIRSVLALVLRSVVQVGDSGEPVSQSVTVTVAVAVVVAVSSSVSESSMLFLAHTPIYIHTFSSPGSHTGPSAACSAVLCSVLCCALL